MTYYSKYLKYKNKYLELKNMIGGGNTPLDYKQINELWNTPNRVHFPVTYGNLQNDFSEYCWIGPPKISNYYYGAGFFLYKIKDGKNTDSIKKDYNYTVHTQPGHASYATWMIDPNKNINMNDSEIKESNIFKTSVSLGELPQGTNYRWEHNLFSWIYQSGDNYYKAKLILPLSPPTDANQNQNKLKNLWDEPNRAHFPITLTHLSQYSEYCWIGPPLINDGYDYGYGFFLYQKRGGGFAVSKITLDNVDKIETIEEDPNVFKTSIHLLAGKLLPGTNYRWDHYLNCWIYQSCEKYYKAALTL